MASLTRILAGSLLILAGAYAQSYSVSSTAANYPSKNDLPSMCADHSCPVRVEGLFHDWGASPSGFPVIVRAAGFYMQFIAGTPNYIFLTSYWESSNTAVQIPLLDSNNNAAQFITWRYQRDPVAMTQTIEVWDQFGKRVFTRTLNITDQANTDGGIQLGAATMSTGWFRIHTTLVALNSRPPVASDANDVWANWQFQNNLSDSGTRGYTLTMPTPAFVATPYQTPVAKARVWGAYTWADNASLRTGTHTDVNRLDGSQSYSPSEGSSAVTCAWSLVSGAGTVTLDNSASCSPTITNSLTAGEYTFQLQVTAAAQNGTTTLTTGAVATDNNWNVQHSSAIADAIFGPMKAWGRSPWGYPDVLMEQMSDGRYAQYIAAPFNLSATWPYAPWDNARAGTVSYKFNGLGLNSISGAGTTITSAIAASGTAPFTVSDVTKLDLSVLPARVYVWVSAAENQWEEIRICTVSTNQLTPCSGGRGTADSATGRLAAQAWASGSNIGQFRLTGTGTAFTTTLCAAGSAPNRKAVLHLATVNTSDTLLPFGVFGCESDTDAYLFGTFDGSIYGISPGQQFTGKQYAYVDSETNYFNSSSFGGLNFYGEGLAHRALYLQSNRTKFQTRSDMLNTWTRYRGGVCQGSILFCGGYVIESMASAALSADGHRPAWTDLRGFAKQGAAAVTSMTGGNCNLWDSRETGYLLSWLNIAALADDDTTSTNAPGGISYRAYWRTFLQAEYDALNACKQADNSFRNTFYWNPYGDQVTFTNGSKNATAAAVSASTCSGIASGSGTATAGSGIITGSGFVSGTRIAITGTLAGQPFTLWQYFTLNSSSQITLASAATWPGDSGAVTWIVDNSDWMLTFMANQNDSVNGNKAWSCIKTSSTTLTLDRPWTGASGTYGSYRGNVVGYAQQPYMGSILLYAMRMGALAAQDAGSTTLAANYRALRGLTATWIITAGRDPVTKGFYYAIQAGCTPLTPASMGNSVCYSGQPSTGAYNAVAERELTGENSDALWANFDTNNGNSASVAIGDQWYGALWGAPGYTDATVYAPGDGNTEANTAYRAANAYAQGKWFGFFGGRGMRHQWPALRDGVTNTTLIAPLPYGGQIAFGGKLILQ